MCCDVPEHELMPPEVAEAVAEYRKRLAQRPLDWGDEGFRWPERHRRLVDAAALFAAVDPDAPDWDDALRRCVAETEAADLAAGFAVLRVDENGIAGRCGPRPWVIPGHPIVVDVLIDSRVEQALELTLTAEPLLLGAGQARLVPVSVSHEAPSIHVTDQIAREATLEVAEAVAAAEVVVESDRILRWSIDDGRGGGWYPEGALPKRDLWDRAFFHARSTSLAVPAVPLGVSATGGLEFETANEQIDLLPGQERSVRLLPRRRIDPAAKGWYGGDLHVHLNYSGDLVCEPHDAARMQRGEGLHLMNLVAANAATALIYDRVAFEAFLGRDLPWSDAHHVARWGVEYRNDLFGHFHALAPGSAPVRYQTGHTRSEHPDDWPPNAAAAAEMRSVGATIGYTHPVFSAMEGDDPSAVFADKAARSVEARELVADAALGLVDSVDLLGPNHPDGSARLYHHLLSCGFPLAATVGTDVFLSFSRARNFSNPPGWARVYAQVGSGPLSVAGFQAAVRAGRTQATNGPWLELRIDGEGPGAIISREPDQLLDVQVDCLGVGVDAIEVVGPDGVVASVPVEPGADSATLAAKVPVTEPTWLAAIARGGAHPECLGSYVFAHTSPIWVEVNGHRVACPADARWCLDWLDRFEELCRRQGHFADDAQLNELVGVLDAARGVYRSIAAPDLDR